MPPPASLQAPAKRGHHMGDYIPPEELEKFLETCNDASARKAAREAAEKMKIEADNVGHKLLSKMGWREGEVLPEDDIYEQYKKRMMLGYRYRLNPLVSHFAGNPRKAYY
ncbi:hypothetical protein Droror1_Dr00015986 [Drosera rotundifolia]